MHTHPVAKIINIHAGTQIHLYVQRLIQKHDYTHTSMLRYTQTDTETKLRTQMYKSTHIYTNGCQNMKIYPHKYTQEHMQTQNPLIPANTRIHLHTHKYIQFKHKGQCICSKTLIYANVHRNHSLLTSIS